MDNRILEKYNIHLLNFRLCVVFFKSFYKPLAHSCHVCNFLVYRSIGVVIRKEIYENSVLFVSGAMLFVVHLENCVKLIV